VSALGLGELEMIFDIEVILQPAAGEGAGRADAAEARGGANRGKGAVKRAGGHLRKAKCQRGCAAGGKFPKNTDGALCPTHEKTGHRAAHVKAA